MASMKELVSRLARLRPPRQPAHGDGHGRPGATDEHGIPSTTTTTTAAATTATTTTTTTTTTIYHRWNRSPLPQPQTFVNWRF